MNRKEIATRIRASLSKADHAATLLINERLQRNSPPLDSHVIDTLREVERELANIANQIALESPHLKG